MVRILSLDPGYERCGIAVIEKPPTGREVLLFSDCLKTPASEPFQVRLGMLAEGIRAAIRAHEPQAAALERLYFNTNQKTAFMVAEVRGMVRLMFHEAGMPVFEYTPQQIKVAVTGSGRSDKKAVAAMVSRLIHIEKSIRHDDEYDAIAVGLTCLASERSLGPN